MSDSTTRYLSLLDNTAIPLMLDKYRESLNIRDVLPGELPVVEPATQVRIAVFEERDLAASGTRVDLDIG